MPGTGIESLASPDTCGGALSEDRLLPRDPELRDAAGDVVALLTRIEFELSAEDYREAAEAGARAVELARTVGHEPLVAEASVAFGRALAERGELAEAEAQLRAGLHAAETGRHDDAAVTAWNQLAWVVGYRMARHDEGRRLLEHAQAWERRLGDAPEQTLSRLRTLGWIEVDAGNFEDAMEAFDRALEVAEDLPPQSPGSADQLALVLNGRGAAAIRMADVDRASESFARAASVLEGQLGPGHPDVARVRNNLSSLLLRQGKAGSARDLLVRNAEIFEAHYGPEHPSLGATFVNLAVAQLELGEYDQAEASASRAIEVLDAVHGPDHPSLGRAYDMRGDARLRQKDFEAALEDLERAREITLRTLGPDHYDVAMVLAKLGEVQKGLGQHAVALGHYERALAVLESELGLEHPYLGYLRVGRAVTLQDLGRDAEALADLRRAVELADPKLRPEALTRLGELLIAQGRFDAGYALLEEAYEGQQELEIDSGFLADTSFALARARARAGRAPSEVIEVAEVAVDAYARSGDPKDAEEVSAWLEAFRAIPSAGLR